MSIGRRNILVKHLPKHSFVSGNARKQTIKMKILTSIFLLVTFSCLGQKSYSISKGDFTRQFGDTIKLDTVYCTNKNGEIVWLKNSLSNGVYLVLELKNDDHKKIKLQPDAVYKNGKIEGTTLNEVLSISKSVSIDLNDVSVISVETNNETPCNYLDSTKIFFRFKCDSLSKSYSSGTQFVIYLKSKKEIDRDSFLICENACYCINFTDNNKIKNGVVNKITKDSIYIYNSFDANTAKADNLEYKLLRYSIYDIKELKPLRGGGYSYKTISVKDYDIVIDEVEKNKSICPCWFRINPRSGKIEFYRGLLTLNGFYGLTEQGGKLYWDEH